MILVSGGTGFVGSGIVRELVRRGKAVAVLTRDASKKADRFPGLSVEYRQGDVTDPGSLVGVLDGMETVIGAQQFPNSPIENPGKGHTFEKVDAEGSENLVVAAKAAGARQFIYLSATGAAPTGRHWFRAKWRAEAAVRNSGLIFTILRPPWVYGPEDVSLNRFLNMSNLLPFVPLLGSPGKQEMQPVFIDDVGWAAAESVDNANAAGETFELGGPEVMTMSEIVKTALGVAGRKRLLLPAPKFVMKGLASLLQFAPGRPLTPDAVEFICMDAVGDPAEAVQKIGFKPTPLREGLATYMGKK
ncbi:MAG TPA: NAD(P)H-binding protein [Dehalococcoidia bacterium]|nr:NAD(P)H-binding protein [Dehalococcoidia bacterium]